MPNYGLQFGISSNRVKSMVLPDTLVPFQTEMSLVIIVLGNNKHSNSGMLQIYHLQLPSTQFIFTCSSIPIYIVHHAANVSSHSGYRIGHPLSA